jgi:hypothetical protein
VRFKPPSTRRIARIAKSRKVTPLKTSKWYLAGDKALNAILDDLGVRLEKFHELS